ncbi:MAG TPA: Cys-Gln thioester bond-forming surface protein [Candidatus Onthousia faecavium]|nr:Cys-Gln thioester bond-forming surface protein [Candidatus Onthousia faecavium]
MRYSNVAVIDKNVVKNAILGALFFILFVVLVKGPLITYGAPTELPDTLTTGMGNILTDRVSLFDNLYGDEIIALVPYYATDSTGIRYTVYCLEKDKGWPSNDSPRTITKNATPLDAGYVYLLQNGYPNKSLTGNDAYDDYLTQIALWWYQDLAEGKSNLTTNQKDVIMASNYYQYIESLINGAVNAKNNPVTINPSFSISSSDFKLSSDHKYLITDNITVNSNVSFQNYKVSVNNSAVEILDSNNNLIGSNTIPSGQPFKLRVNLADINSPITVNISVVVNYTEYEAYRYDPPAEDASNMQQAISGTLAATPKEKTISSSVTMPTGSLTINKVDSNGNNPLAGARIEIVRVATNTVVDSFTTTTTSHTTSNLLPGEYEIRETSAPNGYYIDNSETTVVIDSSNLNISRTLTNSRFEAYIRKVDSDTGAVVSGAVLRILDNNNGTVATVTTENDYVAIPNLAEGTYKVVEISAPSGYLVSDEVKTFTVDKDHTKVNVDYADKKNEILIEKRDASDNNFVEGATLRLVNTDTNSTVDEWVTGKEAHRITGLAVGNYKVVEIAPPSGYSLSSEELTFTITNTMTENLTLTFYNSKNQITINKIDSKTKEAVVGAKMEIVNSSGRVIESFTSSKSPYTISKLEPGTYYVREKEAPSGYVKSEETVSFVVNRETTNINVTFENKKNELRLGKVDSDGNFMAGAELKLTNSDGETVAEFTSGNEAHVISGLASGTYKLEEIKAPDGYIRNTHVETITIKETDSVVTYNMPNEKINITLNKIDADTKMPLAGIRYELLNSEKEVIGNYVTSDTPLTLNILEEGTYYLRETMTIDGYILDDSLHEFTVDSTNYNYEITLENKPTVVSLGKIDAGTNQYISGATLKLSKVDGTMEPITFVTTDSPHIIKRLAPGTYMLEEIEAPAGYVLSNSKITFVLEETGEMQTVNITNEVLNVVINNKRVEIEAEAGFKFSLETSEGEKVTEFTTTNEKYVSDPLNNGDYVLRQLEAKEGIVVNNNPLYFSITDDNNVKVVNFVNDYTKVMISKKDMANSEELEGAQLIIYNDKGEIVEEWTSTDTPHYIERLPIGYYTLKEINAPDGYVVNTATVDFRVLETGDIQTETMFNSKPIDVPNTSSNSNVVYIIGGLIIMIGGALVIIGKRKSSVLSR